MGAGRTAMRRMARLLIDAIDEAEQATAATPRKTTRRPSAATGAESAAVPDDAPKPKRTRAPRGGGA
jgi:hypothetical protein